MSDQQTTYVDQLPIVKAAEDELRSQGRNLAIEFEARAASGFTFYDTNFGQLDLVVLSAEHQNERDWPARTISDAQQAIAAPRAEGSPPPAAAPMKGAADLQLAPAEPSLTAADSHPGEEQKKS